MKIQTPLRPSGGAPGMQILGEDYISQPPLRWYGTKGLVPISGIWTVMKRDVSLWGSVKTQVASLFSLCPSSGEIMLWCHPCIDVEHGRNVDSQITAWRRAAQKKLPNQEHAHEIFCEWQIHVHLFSPWAVGNCLFSQQVLFTLRNLEIDTRRELS